MIAMTAPPLPLRERGLLGWIVPASIAIHVVAVIVLPSATRGPKPPPPVVIEMADLPPPEPKLKEPEKAPEPAPTAAPTHVATRPTSTAPMPDRPARTNEPPRDDSAKPPSDDVPMDLTAMKLSNDGPGIAINAGPGGGGGSRGPVLAAPAARPATPVAPRLVPVGSLAKPPRAPSGLDAELEKNYPDAARRAGIAGKAVLKVTILPDGRIGTVARLSETYDGFGSACERTVRASRWEPPVDREGSAVSTEITYVCRFEVRS